MADSYTITLKDGGTGSDMTASLTSTTVADYVDAGAEYVSAVAPEGKVYYAKAGAGLKFGNSSGGGKVTLTLATPIKPTSIVVSASQFGASEGSGQFQGQTFDMTAGGGKYSFNDYTVTYDGNTEVTTIAVGAAKRGYVNSITVNYAASQGGGEGGDDPQSTTRTIYLNGGGASLWNQADAVFFIHAWGGTEADVIMAQVEGDVYSASIPADNANLCFVRMAPGSEAINWDTRWNQSTDQTIPADKNLFTMTDWSNGTWSVYGEGGDDPVEPTLANGFYLIGQNGWTVAALNADLKFAVHEGDEYVLTATLAENDPIKVVKVENDVIVGWYPDGEGTEYIVDAAHAGEKDIYFQEAYKADWAEFGGYFWTGATEVPVADFTKPFVLKFNGNGSSDNSITFKVEDGVAAIFDYASAPYVSSLTTVSNVYAGRTIADEPSSLKFGTTSKQGTLAFMLSEAIEVDSIIVNATQYGNNASKITINDVEFDITAGNKIPQDFVIIPEDEVSEIVISQSSSERLYLRYVKVFPHVAGEEPETPAKYYITGDSALVGAELQWHPDAIKVMEDEYIFENLAAGDYKLKVTVDGDWSTGKGYSDLTVKAEGLSTDGDNNVIFTLAEAGDVTITYKAAAEEEPMVFTVEGNFYVKPVVNYETLKLVPGLWDEADAKMAVYVWGDEIESSWSAFFAGEGDTLSALINEKADSMVLVRFNSAVEAPTWENEEQNVWNKIDKIEIDHESLVYTVTDWTAGQWDPYVTPEPPVLEDGYYLIGLNGWDVTDLNASLKLELNTAAAEGAVEYMIGATLAEGNEFKIVSVANDAIVTWYPGEGMPNYTVDANHAGQKTVYFRPNGGMEGWHQGYIWVDSNETTGMINTEAENVVVKQLYNGQVIIRRGERVYTIMGQLIK